MWAIQVNDCLGKSLSILCTGAKNRVSCLPLMEEYLEYWAKSNKLNVNDISCDGCADPAHKHAPVVYVTSKTNPDSVLLELTAFEITGTLEAHIADGDNADDYLVSVDVCKSESVIGENEARDMIIALFGDHASALSHKKTIH